MALKSWKDLYIGGIIEKAGNSQEYETGGWRAFRPVIDMKKCNSCMICWIFCPDSSILVAKSRVIGIDYSHCKGCGICAKECPTKVVAMVEELAALAEEGKK